MRDWTPTELAYLAGFLDGEGSICIFNHRDKRSLRSTPGSILRLSAYNTNREVLEWIAFRFGGRVGLVKRRVEYRKQGYIWERGGRDASEILIACLPYLKIKRQQAELFVEVAKTLKNRGRHHSVPDDIVDFRAKAAEKMAALNAKGVQSARAETHEEGKYPEEEKNVGTRPG